MLKNFRVSNKVIRDFLRGKGRGNRYVNGRNYILKDDNRPVTLERKKLILEEGDNEKIDELEYVIVNVLPKQLLYNDVESCRTDEWSENRLFRVVSKRFNPTGKVEIKFVNYEKFLSLASGQSIQKAFTDAAISVTNK